MENSSLVLETISEKFAMSKNSGIAFAYCEYNATKEQQDPATFVATFIKQLSRAKKDLPAELEKIFGNRNRNARKPSYLELRQLFLEVAIHFEKVFVVIDALDEFDRAQRPEFIPFLRDIMNFTGGCIKLFIISRKEDDIECAFIGVPTIQVEATKVVADIELYIEGELEKRLEEDTLKMKDHSLKDAIIEALLGKAGGM